MDDRAILAAVPGALASLLDPPSGHRRYEGGLHLRGACRAPEWNSLRKAWQGPRALHLLFPAIEEGDVPFAQTALGDQWLLRDHAVLRLVAETGRIEDPGVSLGRWWRSIEDDPVGFLRLAPLVDFRRAGGRLAPGELLARRTDGFHPAPVRAVLEELAAGARERC